MNRKRRIAVSAAAVVIILAALLFFTYHYLFFRGVVGHDDHKSELVITNLSVGKADCAVLKYKDVTGIIDLGTEDSFAIISRFLGNPENTDIDFLILTHYDEDHVGCALRFLSEYDVKDIYLPDYVSTKESYLPLTAALESKDNVYFVSEEKKVKYLDLYLRLMPPSDPEPILEDEKNRDNNMSLMCMAGIGLKKFFFTGDIENDRMEQLISGSEDIRADWIKLPHHGDYKKKTDKFLNNVSPTYAVISTSADTPPEDKLIEYLQEDGIKTCITAFGSVTTRSDGLAIVMEQ